jgi:DNA-binding transcriptional MerR regulator
VTDNPFTVDRTYTMAEAAELGGVAYPTVAYLAAKNIVRPSIKVGGHQGAANVYSFTDVLALRSISELRRVPAALATMSAVAAFWSTKQGKELAATRARGKVLVVTPAGKTVLRDDASVLKLTRDHGSNVLHVINAGGLVEDVHVNATESHFTGRDPRPRGRPRGSKEATETEERKPSRRRGKRQARGRQPQHPRPSR